MKGHDDKKKSCGKKVIKKLVIIWLGINESLKRLFSALQCLSS